ncbi:hypothetical protein ACHAWF_010803 [Thalassiosira exigua]
MSPPYQKKTATYCDPIKSTKPWPPWSRCRLHPYCPYANDGVDSRLRPIMEVEPGDIAVNVVELGRSIDAANHGHVGGGGDDPSRRTSESPVRRTATVRRAGSMPLTVAGKRPSQFQKLQPQSVSAIGATGGGGKQSSRRRGGQEKLYKGRANRRAQEEQQEQGQQHQQQRDDRYVGAAPWAQMRRKSRDASDAVRRRLSNAAQSFKELDLEQLAAAHLRRKLEAEDKVKSARSRGRSSRRGSQRPRLQHGGGKASDATTRRSSADNVAIKRSKDLSKENRRSSDMGLRARDNASPSGDKPPGRRSPKSMLGSEDRRKLERADSLDGSMRKLQIEKEQSSPSKQRPGMLRRGSSYDTSMRDLERRGASDGRRPEATTGKSEPISRRPNTRLKRGNSFDSSMIKKGENLPRARMMRRRSSSFDLSRKDELDSPDPVIRDRTHRRASFDASLMMASGKKDLFAQLRKEKEEDDKDRALDDDVLDGIMDMFGTPAHKKSSGGDRSLDRKGANANRRSSAKSEARNSRRGDRRKSDHAKQMEARLKRTAKKRESLSNKRRSCDETEDPTPDSAESAQSSLNSDGSSDDEHNEWGERKKKKYRMSISPFMACAMCMCYLISIIAFCGLGFWLHLQFFAYDPSNDQTETANDGGGNGYRGSLGAGADDRNKMTPGDVAAPSSSPSLRSNDPTTFTYPPTTIPTHAPSPTPSSMTTTAFPTSNPSSSPTLSRQPSYAPSDSPSVRPTSLPQCPNELLKSVALEDGLLLSYEVVVWGDAMEQGGLLCASLSYMGGPAGWIGLAFSEATRNPTFGRKEAVIGLPGIQASVAVDGHGLGQANMAREGGPRFVNPGKYVIPAGGMGDNGFSGPGLKLLSDKQTLMNGSVAVMDRLASMGITSNQKVIHTTMSFAKYLREPGEIEIDPFGSTLLLYAVAPISDDGTYDDNPEWKYEYYNFLSGTADARSGPVRQRTRQHNGFNRI